MVPVENGTLSGCFSQVGEFYLKAPWHFLLFSPFIHSKARLVEAWPNLPVEIQVQPAIDAKAVHDTGSPRRELAAHMEV